MKLKNSELKSILAEVETEIESLLKGEADALKKAKDDSEGSDDSSGGDSAPAADASPADDAGSAPEASASAPAPEAPAPDASATTPEASGSPAPEASASAPAEASAPAGDPAAAAAPADPEALKAEYAKLSPEELKAHYMAAKAALFEMMGAAGGAGPEASAPAPAPAPAAPPAGPEASASAPVPPPAMKAEVPASMKKVPANGDALKDQSPAVPDAIKKSEKDAEVEDLKQQVELLAKAVDLALGTPVRKAITSVAHIPRTEEPAKTENVSPNSPEVKEKIRKAIGSGKLSKSQKDKIFSYTLGNIGFDQVKDLLETK
jgi:hypothetical protein